MKTPLIIINFKCYEEGTGKNAIKLTRLCKNLSKKYKVSIAISPQPTDIKLLSKHRIPIFSQHVDPIESGAYTGHISILSIKEAGARGSLINHSERKINLEEIEKSIELLRKHRMLSIVCSDSIEMTKKIIKLNPDFLAYEPPELISTGISVSKAKPHVVSETVKLVKRINPKIKVLCGAGITSGEDVAAAIRLGTDGVLISSAIVLAKNQKEKLEEIVKALI